MPLRLPLLIALVSALAAFVVGVHWGTFAAGGSDSSCYLNQARLFGHFTTHMEQPLITAAPWPNAAWTFTPAGHMPSPVAANLIVPICPPGLPLVMTAAHVVPFGEMLVVPLCGALVVWCTYLLGQRLDSARTGAAASVLAACSPIFLYQVVQPMTDVPVTAWWLLALVLAIGPGDDSRHPLAAGLAAAVAVLTRPNLLPLALIIGSYLATVTTAASGRTSRLSGFSRTSQVSGPRRTSPDPPEGEHHLDSLWFILGLAPGLALLGMLQARMYGSPWATGYGAPHDLFQASNVLENFRRYSGWLMDTHTPVILLGAVAPFLTRRAAAWLCLALAVATFAAYLPYRVFDDWWYLRFVLPGIPLMITLSVITIVRIINPLANSFSAIQLRRTRLLILVVSVIAVVWVNTARKRSAFNLAQMEHHFVEAGTFSAQKLPDRAAVLTVLHSGAVHYYSGRPTLSWDTLQPGALDKALGFLRSQGLTPVLMFDATEEPAFRARFERASLIGRLDWPPMARIGRTVRVYDPADRARYFATF
jgi:hypothetical protein